MRDIDPSGKKPLPFRLLPLAQREVALLIVLSLVAAVTLAATRRLAVWSHERRTQTAALWFVRGEQLVSAGSLDTGTAALREAVAADRQNPHYVLALARALADASRTDEARQLLLQLRQSEPDDVEINYRLARLAAEDQDKAEAVRYYTYTMYGLARVGVDRDRSIVRTELITFLLDHGDRQEAVAQLGALGRELPTDARAHLQAARLADKAGNPALAFEEYMKAGHLDGKNADAAVGAGDAAFSLRDFPSAVRELDRAIGLGAAGSTIRARLDLARLVLASDPLSPNLRSGERERRLLLSLARAAERDDSCLRAAGGTAKGTDPTRGELDRLRRQPASALQDPDVLTHAIDLVGQVEATVRARCPSAIEPTDQAWELIAVMHRSSVGPGGGS